MADVTIKPADRADAPSVWRWRNDERTRAMARRYDLVSLERVSDWLMEPAATFIAIKDGNPVGVLKFDEKDGHLWPVINLDPERRGERLSRPFLELGVQEMRERGYSKAFKATIRIENVASLALFVSAGFKVMDNLNGFYFLEH